MATINLILWDNGVGLSRDMQILKGIWSAAGHEVFVTAKPRGTLRKWLQPARIRGRLLRQRWRGDDPAGRFDFNVMLEHIRCEYLHLAKKNVLIPNPEWFADDARASIERIDLVLTKTRHAADLFCGLTDRIRYMGFTSVDRYSPAVPRELAFFHLAGRSRHKGTEALLRLWCQHPEWPRLTVVQHPRMATRRMVAANIDHRVGYLPDAELRRLQNAHQFHLCPSETEGFGHYIVEAMSVGAITLTLDAAPMNELVAPERGILLPYDRTGTHGLATTYHFNDAAMADAIAAALGLDAATRQRMSASSRAWFELNDIEFRQRAVAALN